MQQAYPTSRSTPKLNVLIAYPYFNASVVALLDHLGDQSRFLLDSGAFTAFKSGNPIKLDDYCQFLATIPVKPWRYFTLDEIGDAEATMRNYETMLARGFKPVPIFTRGAPLEHLDHYFATSDLVGLGGVAGRDPGAYRWLKYIVQKAAGRNVHVLGLSSMDWVKYFHPYSTDSSTWNNASRYGSIPVYLGRGQILHMLQSHLVHGMREDVARAIRAGGFDPYLLKHPLHWSGRKEALGRWIGASQFLRLGIEMERALDTLYFLACGPRDLPGVIAGFRAVTQGGDWGDEMKLLRERRLAA